MTVERHAEWKGHRASAARATREDLGTIERTRAAVRLGDWPTALGWDASDSFFALEAAA